MTLALPIGECAFSHCSEQHGSPYDSSFADREEWALSHWSSEVSHPYNPLGDWLEQKSSHPLLPSPTWSLAVPEQAIGGGMVGRGAISASVAAPLTNFHLLTVTSTLFVGFVTIIFIAKTFFFKNKLFKLFIALQCNAVWYTEISKHKLPISMALYVTTKLAAKKIHFVVAIFKW